MKTARLAAFASLRGAFLLSTFASIAGAQNQTWIRQLGTTNHDYAWAAAPDGAGGVYVSGRTRASLGGPQAGGGDAWLAHYDGAGNQTGDTWNFQAWYRDANPGPTSNFTDAVSATFR